MVKFLLLNCNIIVSLYSTHSSIKIILQLKPLKLSPEVASVKILDFFSDSREPLFHVTTPIFIHIGIVMNIFRTLSNTSLAIDARLAQIPIVTSLKKLNLYVKYSPTVTLFPELCDKKPFEKYK